MKGEFNLPQTLLWIVSASRPLGTAEAIGCMIGGMATGRSMGAPPSLAEAFFKLQARFRPRLDGAPAPLIETQVTVATRFGEATSVGREAAELWDDAQAELLEAIRNGSVRAYGRKNGSRVREAIPPIGASEARLVDHEGPSIVPKKFPHADTPLWSDVTCEFEDIQKVWGDDSVKRPEPEEAAVEQTQPEPVSIPRFPAKRRGPKPVVTERVMEAMRRSPNLHRLHDMTLAEMEAEFDASADTVTKARRAVIGERNSEKYRTN